MPLIADITGFFNPQNSLIPANPPGHSKALFSAASLLSSGFSGPVYPDNPKYDSLHGGRCYASLVDLPQPPDLVIYAISGFALEHSFDQALALKVGGIVIYAANYIEDDSEPRLPDRLR
ncbi:MAG: CoA-binding protein [Gammaproteobacteria bacterium]|nr:CoA-binding protein [Gammaproteobacteria bacterium]